MGLGGVMVCPWLGIVWLSRAQHSQQGAKGCAQPSTLELAKATIFLLLAQHDFKIVVLRHNYCSRVQAV